MAKYCKKESIFNVKVKPSNSWGWKNILVEIQLLLNLNDESVVHK